MAVDYYFGTSGQKVVIKYMQDNHLLSAHLMYKKRLEVMEKIVGMKQNAHLESMKELTISLKEEIIRRGLI